MDRLPRLSLELLGALLLYLLCATVMTWPALLHLDEVIIGGGELGGWLWRYWWHFLELEALGSSDIGLLDKLTTFLSLGRYPETGNILDVLLISWPLEQLWDLPASYNLKIFLILVGDGICGYALARSLTSSRSVALAAGVLAVVNPLTIQDIHGSGLRQVLLWFVLLFPVVLARAERLKSPRSGLLAGAVLGLCGAWYWFYGLFAGIFLLLFVGDLLLRERGRPDWRRHLRWAGPTVLAAALVGGLFFLPYAWGDGGAQLGGQGSLPELSFFLTFPDYDVIRDVPLRPSTYEENVLSSLNRTIMSSWSADYLFDPSHPRALPLVVFLGGVLPAALLRPGLFSRSRFWLVVFGVFWLGTLGPFLKWGGEADSSQVVLLGGEWVVRLPYTLMFKWIPGMSRMFAPYRMGALVVVGAVALVAMGLSRIQRRGLRVGVAGLSVLLTLTQVSYRWEVGPVPDDAFQPSMWRPATKVSAIRVPDFYAGLPEARAGLIELPLEQQQDLITYYQLVHGWKVYRSWATATAIPPILRQEGGGAAGEKLRYLAREDPTQGELPQLLLELSRRPENAALESLDRDALCRLLLSGDYRYLVVHERGYYLVDPLKGALLYNDVVARLSAVLGVEPEQSVEMRWFDYPGNEYKVPDGPVYVPWSSNEVNLPDREMPSLYFMAVFDLQPLIDAYDGPPPSAVVEPVTGPVHEEHDHVEKPPGAVD